MVGVAAGPANEAALRRRQALAGKSGMVGDIQRMIFVGVAERLSRKGWCKTVASSLSLCLHLLVACEWLSLCSKAIH